MGKLPRKKDPLGNRPTDHIRKGRSEELLRIRNLKLIERYYQLTEIERRRFDDTLLILEREEFFISQQRILMILRQNTDMLDRLRDGENIHIPGAFDNNQLKLFTENEDSQKN